MQLNPMQNKTNTPALSVLAAALALPGLLPGAAQAQVTAPNATLVQFKFLYYKDYQASGDRMTIKSPALYLLTPITNDWVFEIGAVYDSISGASPYYHTTLSGASGEGIKDDRIAADVTFTKYFANRTSVAVRAAYSDEDDYRSIAGGVTIRHALRTRTRRLRSAADTPGMRSSRRSERFRRTSSAPTMRSPGFRRSSRPMTLRS